jgi:hypothetical protein
MKTITGTSHPFRKIIYAEIINLIAAIDKWIERKEPIWEYSRLGISATGIFIQVTFAAAMIAVLGLAGGSMWIGTVGMLFAFLANSLAFGQVPMRWLLGCFLLSIAINISITIYYAIRLLQ